MSGDPIFRSLADEQDRQLAELDPASEVHGRLFWPTPQASTGRSLRRLAWIGAGAAGRALLVAREWREVPFAVSTSAEPTAAGWYEARGAEPVELLFSDGSSVRLSGGSRARVMTLAERGAELAVERGAVEVHVVPGGGGRWLLHVGPFDLAVVGTRFETAWDPAEEAFSLSAREGRVEVSGPGIEERQVVAAGERLAVLADMSQARATVERSSLDAPPPSPSPAPPPAASSAAAPAASSGLAATDSPPPPAATMAKPSWQALAAKGAYREAWEAVSPFADEVLAQGTASDLSTFATLAAHAGESRRSREAFVALRDRHPSSSGAILAAFELGRMAFGSDPASAARWFETYLAEAPNGALAREALGRLLELRRSGPGGPEVARRYLDRFPDGPHASLARRTLAGGP